MNTLFALTRSTVLADARQARAPRELRGAPPIVHVGGLAMSPRTVVGHARTVLERALGPSRPKVRVGAPMSAVNTTTEFSAPAPTTPLHATVPGSGGTVTITTTTEKPGFIDAIGSTAAWIILGSMIAGPPAVGYLIAGKVGLVVGAVVAAPMVLLFGLAVLGQLPKPQPS